MTGVTDASRPSESYYHLHLVSDSTGETLMSVGRAAAAQYNLKPIEHIYPLVRAHKQLDKVIQAIEEYPGIVLYTLTDRELRDRLKTYCRDNGIPVLSVLAPVVQLFQAYLGGAPEPRVGGQHQLDGDYFRRIDAMNFTVMHDDGQHVDGLEAADVVLLGISRSSKTPTSIYLANRGIKTANIPLVPGLPVPPGLSELRRPLVVGLVASADRVVEIRRNRLLGLNAAQPADAYIDRERVAEEIAFSRRLCARHGWPMIDVTRRSIEETAAAIIGLLQEHRRKLAEQTNA
ncbi:pyruvate, water dikinase regulatory protein [Ancylobacter sp. TS-1]|uniref:pyruvate, water dikinase regulatory protein n=1 Tax=Ancylobacter sp. TS-1 TaxID=1850374 RepID=UPI001265CF2B|nr:pyruvate, water dikinase regulatory protein [Ancylobacter sp. TS-1]QFR33928.1 pyruvate, phosphate dikinase/phosphoenolpyruvate synthase regulator [Ancylobacter sp. TS-1]